MGVSFETLQARCWVASLEGMQSGWSGRGIEMMEQIVDGERHRQPQQINNLIA